MIARLAVLAILTAASSGCVQVAVAKLPAYAKAMELWGPKQPRLFFEEAVDYQGFPAMSPYAVVVAQGRSSREVLARRIWQEAAKIRADVVVVTEPEERHVGDTQVYWGLGISTSEPVYRNIVQGVCYRTSPVKLGLETDANLMVVRIDQDSPVRESGLLEGDTLVSFNGAAWGSGFQAPRHAMALGLAPEQEVIIIWIRPGTGRMEGRATCAKNSGALPKEDSIPWKLRADDDDDRPTVAASNFLRDGF